MDLNEKTKVRAFMDDLLREREDTAGFSDSESIFASGRLESLAAVQLVVFLEEQFCVDFSNLDFEIDRIDSIDLIATLCDEVMG
jgi:acyl carrier protein